MGRDRDTDADLGVAGIDGIDHEVRRSPTHFAIMIDPRYTEIGVGITVAADGTVYEVQEYKAP